MSKELASPFEDLKIQEKYDDDFMKNCIVIDIDIKGTSVMDFIEKHSTSQSYMTKLSKAFSTICEDYNLEINEPSHANHFITDILFKTGPEIRKQTKISNVKRIHSYRFKENKVIIDPSNYNHIISNPVNGKMNLTLTQAELLALAKYSSMVEMLTPIDNKIRWTPFAAAVFKMDDYQPILDSINKLNQPGEDPIDLAELVNIINESCQPDGEYLENSRTDCAAVAVIAFTHKYKTYERENLISALVERYLTTQDKIFDIEQFLIYASYANGGVSSDLSDFVISIATKQYSSCSSDW